MTDSIITIRQGDDTDFADNITFLINITTSLDLTGYSGRFQLRNIIKNYTDITSKSVNIVLSKSETNKLPAGEIKGAFKIFDTNGRACTILSDIKFNVLSEQVKND